MSNRAMRRKAMKDNKEWSIEMYNAMKKEQVRSRHWNNLVMQMGPDWVRELQQHVPTWALRLGIMFKQDWLKKFSITTKRIRTSDTTALLVIYKFWWKVFEKGYSSAV
jgi:hypothetical protein